jgi:hypothetical protein
MTISRNSLTWRQDDDLSPSPGLQQRAKQSRSLASKRGQVRAVIDRAAGYGRWVVNEGLPDELILEDVCLGVASTGGDWWRFLNRDGSVAAEIWSAQWNGARRLDL